MTAQIAALQQQLEEDEIRNRRDIDARINLLPSALPWARAAT